MQPHVQEKRRHPRHRIHLHVEMRGGGEVAVLPTDNISAGGVFLHRTDEDLPGLALGEQVTVFLNASGDEEPLYVTLEARVVRIDSSPPGPRSGLALEWSTPSPEVADKLARALKRFQRLQ